MLTLRQESFYSQLKKLHDDDNTNLYVSNLPKEYNEAVSRCFLIVTSDTDHLQDLSAVFKPHKVCSSRILRDGHGNGRGVGFARYA